MKKNYNRMTAFTLAEVLITIVIVGVVAALTIPTVLKNYNDKKYNTARLKALKTFGEAGKMASINGEINGQPSARAFVENVLSKYLKIVKVCNSNKASECNFPEKFKAISGGQKTSNSLKNWRDLNPFIQTRDELTSILDNNFNIYVMTTDGFSAKIFYNPKCESSASRYYVDGTCVNVIYDMNGVKAPNHAGEDIGIVTTFWSGINSVSVAPNIAPYSINSVATKLSQQGASEYCNNKTTDKKQYRIPNLNEACSLFLNYQLASMPSGNIWTSTIDKTLRGRAWVAGGYGHMFSDGAHKDHIQAWCVRR